MPLHRPSWTPTLPEDLGHRRRDSDLSWPKHQRSNPDWTEQDDTATARSSTSPTLPTEDVATGRIR